MHPGTTKQMMELMQSMSTNQIQVSAYKWSSRQDDDSVFNALYNYCRQMDDLCGWRHAQSILLGHHPV